MTAYSLNVRVFWPLTGTALLGLWQALGTARPGHDGAPPAALLLLFGLLLVLLAAWALRSRLPPPGRPGDREKEAEEEGGGEPPRLRLRAALESFYARQLRLSPHVLGHSKAHVGLVLGEVVRAGKAAGRLALRGDFVPLGSAYEQHKVRRAGPDAFDALVPLRLPPRAALRVERVARRGGAFFAVAPEGLSAALCVEAGRRLSAALVLRWFQGHVQRCLGAVRSRLQERVGVSMDAGPGRPLALRLVPRSDYVCCHLSLDVRLVPAIPFGDGLYLTPLPAFAPAKMATLWTLNAAKPEQRLLAWVKEQSPADACHLKCLQLLKGLRELGGRGLEQPLAAQWSRVLSSYVLKTALLALLLRGPLQAWGDQFLEERLEDLIAFLAVRLRKRRLRHLFLGNTALPEAISVPKFLKEAAPVNLLADFDGPTLDKVATHLLDTWQQAPEIIQMYSGQGYRRKNHPA